ncbi:MAG: hypothetical protein JWN15_4140, partial [Firmicutes bacterium]|nr:hypothetical protein [Bacillota bacterium]
VLALLDRSHLDKPWADQVAEALPEDAERTADMEQVRAFITSA